MTRRIGAGLSVAKTAIMIAVTSDGAFGAGSCHPSPTCLAALHPHRISLPPEAIRHSLRGPAEGAA